MRVIAGSARSIPLVTPEGEELTRPTQDRIKETLFNIIQGYIPGAVFLDLCAGSGGIGIEALSRGAKRCYFAENAREAIACIEKNIHKTHFEDQSVLMKTDVLNAVRNIHEKEADVYTLIIVEAALETDFGYAEELGFEVQREKNYRTQKHVFLKKKQVRS